MNIDVRHYTRRSGARARAVQRAAAVWAELPGDYERGHLAAWGTAFTTYEDHGTAVCSYLNKIAETWRKS